jgi:hypothetical protein
MTSKTYNVPGMIWRLLLWVAVVGSKREVLGLEIFAMGETVKFWRPSRFPLNEILAKIKDKKDGKE